MVEVDVDASEARKSKWSEVSDQDVAAFAKGVSLHPTFHPDVDLDHAVSVVARSMGVPEIEDPVIRRSREESA